MALRRLELLVELVGEVRSQLLEDGGTGADVGDRLVRLDLLEGATKDTVEPQRQTSDGGLVSLRESELDNALLDGSRLSPRIQAPRFPSRSRGWGYPPLHLLLRVRARAREEEFGDSREAGLVGCRQQRGM